MQNWKISKLILGNILQAVCWCQPERDNVPSAWKFKSMGKQKQTCWAHAFVRCSTTEKNIGPLQICCPDLIESSFAEDVILLSNIYCQLSSSSRTELHFLCRELNCPALKEIWNGVDRNSMGFPCDGQHTWAQALAPYLSYLSFGGDNDFSRTLVNDFVFGSTRPECIFTKVVNMVMSP